MQKDEGAFITVVYFNMEKQNLLAKQLKTTYIDSSRGVDS